MLTFVCEADGLISLCRTTHGTLEEFYHLLVDQGHIFFRISFSHGRLFLLDRLGPPPVPLVVWVVGLRGEKGHTGGKSLVSRLGLGSEHLWLIKVEYRT